MKSPWKVIVILILAASVVAVVVLKRTQSQSQQTATTDPQSAPAQLADLRKSQNLPSLVELGAGWCVPCKMMEPILEELKTEYKGKFEVMLINVDQNPNIARQYNISLIPTQIFFDATGKELFRHEGFYSKADILAKWKQLGFDFDDTTE